VYSEAAITVSWQPPKANVDDSTPVNLLGYNVYRATESPAGTSPTLPNREPITATPYAGKTFKFGAKHKYFVRAVSSRSEARPVESTDPSTIPASQIDNYPPAAPTGFSVTSAPGRIALFWRDNTEPDLAGYIILRSTDPNLPTPRWTHLTKEIYTKTT